MNKPEGRAVKDGKFTEHNPSPERTKRVFSVYRLGNDTVATEGARLIFISPVELRSGNSMEVSNGVPLPQQVE